MLCITTEPTLTGVAVSIVGSQFRDADNCIPKNEQQKNYCIITTEFSEENPENCAAFLRTLRETTEIMVECVYVERGNVEILFASSHYKTIMDKDALKKYKKFRGKKIYSKPNDEIVVNELYNINRFSK